jgi:hypothetical protein
MNPLYLQARYGQSEAIVQLKTAQNQTGNALEINSPTGTGGNLAKVDANGLLTLTNNLGTATSNMFTMAGLNGSNVTLNNYGNLTLAGVYTGILNNLIGSLSLQAAGSNSNSYFTTIGFAFAATDTSGTKKCLAVTPSYNQTSGNAANTDLLINRTETSLGSGTQRSIDCQAGLTGGNSVLNVTNAGTLTNYGGTTFSTVQPPTGLTITLGGATGGSTTYGYRVSAVDNNGNETNACTEATTTTAQATLSGTNYTILTWNSVAGAVKYKIYGRTSGSELYMTFVTSTGAATYTYNDTLAATPSGALPGNPTGNTLTVNGSTNQTASLAIFEINGTIKSQIDKNGNAVFPHIVGNSTSPTIAAGAGAGSSPTGPTLIGTDIAGQITLTTGTVTPGANTVLTVTFNTAFTNAPYVNFSPANANAAGLSGTSMIYVNSTTTTFAFLVGTAGLVSATQYIWNYIAIG